MHPLKWQCKLFQKGKCNFSFSIYTHTLVFQDTTCLTLYPAILWLLDLFTRLFRENVKRTPHNIVMTLHPSFKQTHEAWDDCRNQVCGFQQNIWVLPETQHRGTRAARLGSRFKHKGKPQSTKETSWRAWQISRWVTNVPCIAGQQQVISAMSYLSLMKSVSSLEDIWPCFMLW